ncbi:MAG: hypothetical protein ACT6QU_19090 [Aliihoeflea sp.]|uniref:hypothetical protein n=1 Tax=Aliihoeflea sp. TaxID=2608088 RepID=UPI004034803F
MAISDEDWQWLKERYGDFVLEEPAYAPKLLEVRDTLRAAEPGLRLDRRSRAGSRERKWNIHDRA